MKPAWSWQFDDGTLPRLDTDRLPATITPDWAWGGSTGASVRVAVLDSGVEGAHPAVGRTVDGVVIEADPSAESGVRITEGPHADLFGHGTACAGIILGLAPGCELFSVRVLGTRLTGKGTAFAAGLRWAIAHGMNVVNLSLSTPKRDYFGVFHEIADEAYFRRVMLVCAVNNVPTASYPSEYSSVFSVAATAGADPLRFRYNPSPPVEFGAPGIDVEVPWLDGGYIRATGNSFAAPCIAGVIARILGKHPGLTPFEMKTVLVALAENVRDVDEGATAPER